MTQLQRHPKTARDLLRIAAEDAGTKDTCASTALFVYIDDNGEDHIQVGTFAPDDSHHIAMLSAYFNMILDASALSPEELTSLLVHEGTEPEPDGTEEEMD